MMGPQSKLWSWCSAALLISSAAAYSNGSAGCRSPLSVAHGLGGGELSSGALGVEIDGTTLPDPGVPGFGVVTPKFESSDDEFNVTVRGLAPWASFKGFLLVTSVGNLAAADHVGVQNVACDDRNATDATNALTQVDATVRTSATFTLRVPDLPPFLEFRATLRAVVVVKQNEWYESSFDIDLVHFSVTPPPTTAPAATISASPTEYASIGIVGEVSGSWEACLDSFAFRLRGGALRLYGQLHPINQYSEALEPSEYVSGLSHYATNVSGDCTGGLLGGIEFILTDVFTLESRTIGVFGAGASSEDQIVASFSVDFPCQIVGASVNESQPISDVEVDCSRSAVPTVSPTSALVCASMIMTDSGGDGWNGAFYTIKSSTANGTIEATGTLAEGSNGDDVVCLDDGTYTLEVGGGTNDSEIGWEFGPLAGSAPYGPEDLFVNFSVIFGRCDEGNTRDVTSGNCIPCAAGKFSGGGADFKISCEDCAAGKFSPVPGQATCLTCPVGTNSTPGSPDCSFCPPANYPSSITNITCNGAGDITCNPCPSGTHSLTGQSCLDCGPGSYTKDRIQCTRCPGGQFSEGARNAQCDVCPPGTFSNPGAMGCSPCPEGQFSQSGASSCTSCQLPLTIKGKGSTSCDACIEDFFWNSLISDDLSGTEEEVCIDCCTRCEDMCDVEDAGDCVKCGNAGSELQTLNVTRGWWRATKKSLTVYECPLDRSCRGGSTTKDSKRCFQGHFGALCGACRKGYDYDIARNRCTRCTRTGDMLRRAGNLILIIAFSCAAVLLLVMWLFPNVFSLRTVCFDLMRAIAIDVVAAGTAVSVLNDATEDEAKESHADIEPRETKAGGLKRAVLTKLKIVVASWQIASSTDEVFRQVRFPPIFHKVTGLFGLLGFAIMDVGSFKCLLGWTYFDELLFVTLGPFVVVLLGATSYWAIQRYRGKLETEADRRKAASEIKYASLLFIFVVLPSISSYVITYFSCAQCRNQV